MAVQLAIFVHNIMNNLFNPLHKEISCMMRRLFTSPQEETSLFSLYNIE